LYAYGTAKLQPSRAMLTHLKTEAARLKARKAKKCAAAAAPSASPPRPVHRRRAQCIAAAPSASPPRPVHRRRAQCIAAAPSASPPRSRVDALVDDMTAVDAGALRRMRERGPCGTEYSRRQAWLGAPRLAAHVSSQSYSTE
jgi:hypothetical protein